MRLGVYGAGAWGTALAVAFSRSHEVHLWGRETAIQEEMAASRRNPRYLPEAVLPPELAVETDFAVTAGMADLHLVVTPLAGLRTTVRELHRITPGIPLLWACKGLEAETCRLPHEIVAEELTAGTPSGVLTGPSFAAEVAQGLPTAITLVCSDLRQARDWCQQLHQPRLRLYANDDVVGAEVGGAVKNVMAIAAGISDGLGSGRSLPELLHGLGHVAEGVSTAQAVDSLARRRGVEMPITAAVAALLRGEVTPLAAVEALLARDPTTE